jgi:hypothetical protein
MELERLLYTSPTAAHIMAATSPESARARSLSQALAHSLSLSPAAPAATPRTGPSGALPSAVRLAVTPASATAAVSAPPAVVTAPPLLAARLGHVIESASLLWAQGGAAAAVQEAVADPAGPSVRRHTTQT